MTNNETDLQALIENYPGKLAALARKAGIERSTLYRFANGQRTPSEAQLYRLGRAMELPPDRIGALVERYAGAHDRDEMALRTAWYRLLAALFRVPQTDTLPPARPETAPGVLCLEGEDAVAGRMEAMLTEYLAGEDERPLMLSPALGQGMEDALLRGFRTTTGGPRAVWQILPFTPDSGPAAAQTADVHTLARTVPLLFLEKMNYVARFGRVPDPVPGGLMPLYLLFPEGALFMNAAGDRAFCLTDPDGVTLLRTEYSSRFLASGEVLTLASESHNYDDSLHPYASLITPTPPCCMLRRQPPFSTLLDPELTLNATGPLQALPDRMVRPMLTYLDRWTRLKPDAYFSEAGILEFVYTGRLCDIADELYAPLPIDLRRELLVRLRRRCAEGEQTLRLADPAAFDLTPYMLTTVFRGRGAVICQRLDRGGPLCCREYKMTEPCLTESIWQYFAWLKTTDLVRTQKDTLDFIDSCIAML